MKRRLNATVPRVYAIAFRPRAWSDTLALVAPCDAMNDWVSLFPTTFSVPLGVLAPNPT
jgi:hypothetical protein